MSFTPSTTESAIEAIVAQGKQFLQNEKKNWKRIKKFVPIKEQCFDLRVFKNKVTNQIVTVMSSDDKYSSVRCENGEAVYSQVFNCDWNKPDKKKFPVVLQDRCSGRMVFCIDAEEEEEEGVVPFCCGPEESGHLCDNSHGWENETLRELFGSRLNLQESESCHSLNLKEGESVEDAIDFIKTTLLTAGAVEF